MTGYENEYHHNAPLNGTERDMIARLILLHRRGMIEADNWRSERNDVQDMHNIMHHIDARHECVTFMNTSESLV